jgi:hypothetical protein
MELSGFYDPNREFCGLIILTRVIFLLFLINFFLNLFFNIGLIGSWILLLIFICFLQVYHCLMTRVASFAG